MCNPPRLILWHVFWGRGNVRGKEDKTFWKKKFILRVASNLTLYDLTLQWVTRFFVLHILFIVYNYQLVLHTIIIVILEMYEKAQILIEILRQIDQIYMKLFWIRFDINLLWQSKIANQHFYLNCLCSNFWMKCSKTQRKL